MAALLVAVCTIDVVAQSRSVKASFVRMQHHGKKMDKPKVKKKKKQKIRNFTHTQPAKGTRSDAWSTRKKYS